MKNNLTIHLSNGVLRHIVSHDAPFYWTSAPILTLSLKS